MGRSVHLCALFALVPACATNPAKHPAPNGTIISYEDGADNRWRRGAENLDEQDFYELAGDKKSVAEIEAHRSSGVRRQIIGNTLIAAGLGALAGTAFLYTQRESLFGEDSSAGNWAVYGAAAATVILVGGGWKVRKSGVEKVNERPILDRLRAEEAIVIARFGSSTVGPGGVTAIEWDLPAKFCVTSGAILPPIQLRDRTNQLVELPDANWTTVTATPAESFVDGRIVGTPLASLDQPITLTVAVRDNKLTKSFQLAPDFGCRELLEVPATVFAKDGQRGGRGDTGYAAEAGAGEDGDPGADAADGPAITAEAAFVTYKGQRLLAVAMKSEERVWVSLVDPTKGHVKISAVGPTGGNGGNGGDGGTLDTALVTETNGCRRLKSGNGGNGGKGGKGGRGGDVTLRGPKSAIDAVEIDVSGGAGGQGGRYGSSGEKTGCGTSGTAGDSGEKGESGADGELARVPTSTSELSMLKTWLGGSELQIEAGGSEPAKKPKKR
jgi:hypothetical protein